MEKCKFCQAELAENGTFCPNCGRNNAEADPIPAEEAVVEKSTSKAGAAAQPEIKEGAKATPGKIALMVVAIVIVAAVIVALLAGGLTEKLSLTGILSGKPLSSSSEPTGDTVAASETMEATIPADGNPDDETCKGSYTASDEEVIANAATVVAHAGDYELTNGQLQVLYWLEVQSFLNNYGSYASYFGLDYTQPLDTQSCSIAETGTWQQFFLASCLSSWQNYQSMAAEAEANGFQMDAELRDYLDNLPANLEENAVSSGFASAEELLAYNVGNGASMQDYVDFMEIYYLGYEYFNSVYESYEVTDAEIEAYFTENEAAYTEAGVTKDGKYVDVRHILVMPEGGTVDDSGTTVYSDEAWEACRLEGQAILDEWLAGEKTEDSFAALANEYTEDGNDVDYDGVPDGGLYTYVTEGQMVEPFENWCFDEVRQPGDYGLVQTQYGYHVMYFVSSYPIWSTTVKEDMATENANNFVAAATAKYPLTADFSAILLAESGLTG